ncbi:MAG: M24 family metallopeptidase [Acidobacteriota bacterium]
MMMKVPAEEIAGRLVTFQALLAKAGIDGAIIRQNSDLYYFTGTVQDAHLLVPAQGRPVFMVRRDVGRAEAQSPLRPIVAMKSMQEIRPAMFEACSDPSPRRIGMELDVIPANTFFLFDEKLFPRQEIVDISEIVRQMRTVKSPWEVEMMRSAASIATVVAEAVPGLLREGVTEYELNAELALVARRAGDIGALRFRAFNREMPFGHILSGPEAAMPSYMDAPTGGPGLSPAFGQGSGSRRIGRGEVVSVDVMVSHHGYLNDQTRNYCIGSPPRELAEAYRFIRVIHERFKEAAKPGAACEDLYNLVWKWVSEEGRAEHFMGASEPRITFVGHGIGLEVDEYPFIAKGQKLKLEEGMTIAFEPKFIVPGLGIVGLENTYLVTGSGLESLNAASEEMVIV